MWLLGLPGRGDVRWITRRWITRADRAARGWWGTWVVPAYIAVPCPPSPRAVVGSGPAASAVRSIGTARTRGPILRRSQDRVHCRGAGFYTRTDPEDYRFRSGGCSRARPREPHAPRAASRCADPELPRAASDRGVRGTERGCTRGRVGSALDEAALLETGALAERPDGSPRTGAPRASAPDPPGTGAGTRVSRGFSAHSTAPEGLPEPFREVRLDFFLASTPQAGLDSGRSSGSGIVPSTQDKSARRIPTGDTGSLLPRPTSDASAASSLLLGP